MFDYICTNGTKADGQTTEKDTQKCASCNDGFRLENERCVQEFDYICTNGTRATGKTTQQGTEKCTACNSGFRLENERCVQEFDYICTNGTKADGKTTQQGTEKCAACNDTYKLDNERCVAVRVAVLYQAVSSSTNNRFKGNLNGANFNVCRVDSPAPLMASQGYEGHTLYGSTTDANGNFSQLTTRLGGDNPGTREIRLFRAGATRLHTPTTTTTLSELIDRGTNGAYANTAKVQRIFRWMQHGDETMANSNYQYWTFTNASGSYVSGTSCADALDTTPSSRGIIGEHDGSSHSFSKNTTGEMCSSPLVALCLARRH